MSRRPMNASDQQRLTAQPRCPKCQSPDTCSAAKRPTADSYWRCLRCGEVWNPSLLVGASKHRRFL